MLPSGLCYYVKAAGLLVPASRIRQEERLPVQFLAHLDQELVGREGFWEEVQPGIEDSFLVDNVAGVSSRTYPFATRTRVLFSFMPSMMAPRPAIFWR